MDKTSFPQSSHSADVRIELRVNGHILPVAQLGPTFLILKKPIDHPPADAEIVMSIDGDESRWPIRLGAGLSNSEPETEILPAQSNGPTVG
jgi:hypothetical protein